MLIQDFKDFNGILIRKEEIILNYGKKVKQALFFQMLV